MPSTFWNSSEKLWKNWNGRANQNPNEVKIPVWDLVELMMIQTTGTSVKMANSTQAVVIRGTVPLRSPYSWTGIVASCSSCRLPLPAPPMPPGLRVSGPHPAAPAAGANSAHASSPLRRRNNSEPTEMTMMTRPSTTAMAAPRLYWALAIEVL